MKLVALDFIDAAEQFVPIIKRVEKASVEGIRTAECDPASEAHKQGKVETDRARGLGKPPSSLR
jgi:hypothetical protein